MYWLEAPDQVYCGTQKQEVALGLENFGNYSNFMLFKCTRARWRHKLKNKHDKEYTSSFEDPTINSNRT